MNKREMIDVKELQCFSYTCFNPLCGTETVFDLRSKLEPTLTLTGLCTEVVRPQIIVS